MLLSVVVAAAAAVVCLLFLFIYLLLLLFVIRPGSRLFFPLDDGIDAITGV